MAEPTPGIYVCFLHSLARPDAQAVQGHVQFLRDLDNQGRLVLCGPFADGRGGVVCFRAESRQEAERLVQTDPFVALGFKSFELRQLIQARRDNGYLLDP